MIGERSEALSSPAVSVSAFNARSGGQSVASLSWESRPFEMPSLTLRSVSEGAPAVSRYWLSVMPIGLDYLNQNVQEKSLVSLNAFNGGGNYYGPMAAPRHDWFLGEWLRSTGKRQSDIVKDLDWNKAKVSLMVRGLQPYTREEVNQLAAYLEIRPHELLMHPDDAYAIRRLRADMIRLAHETEDRDGPVKKVSSN